MSNSREIPTGTITFLFTDIEGSTRLLQELGQEQFIEVVERHHEILRSSIQDAGGVDVGTEGDAFFAVFTTAGSAVAAAAAAQRAMAAATWPSPVRVRMGMHTGQGIRGGDNYVGLDVHIAARIAAAASGGQVLISETTRALIDDQLPESVELADLGEHRLKDLTKPQKLFQLNIQGLRSEFPPIRTLGHRHVDLPSQLTSFVGRGREIDQLQELLGRTRCLTLTGPGGTGKTRLSIELARNSAEQFENGTYFVQLAPLRDPEMVAPEIAETLHLPETRGETRSPVERLAEHLKEKQMLLVLDNFEQLVAGAGIVAELLGAAEKLKVVVTTRVPLHIQGEREYPVPPLILPDPSSGEDAEQISHYESVALFIERAVAVRPEFQVTNQNAPAIAEICARLDGLPLAIELAAARVRILTPEKLLARLGDRLKLLVGGSSDIPKRQQTLRGAIEWSYELLDQAERRLFARFSVFSGGSRLEEAEEVCGSDDLGVDVFDGLSSLVEKSLIKTAEDTPSDLRFFMLETIREFAQEKLSESDEKREIHAVHAEAYTKLAESAAPYVFGRGRKEWLDKLSRDHDNLREAHDWAIENQDKEIALRLVVALWRFWHMRGHLQEGRRRAEESLALPGADEPTPLRAKALQAAGGIAHWQAETESQAKFYDEAIAIWEKLGDAHGVADAKYDRVFAYMYGEGGPASAIPYAEEGLALAEKAGVPKAIANAKWVLSLSLGFGAGQFERASQLVAEAMETYRKEDDAFMQIWALYAFGNIALAQDKLDEAEEHFRQAMLLSVEGMDLSGILFQLDNLSATARKRGDDERAVRLAAVASSLKASSGAGLVDATRAHANIPTLGKEALTSSRLEEIWAESEKWGLEEAIAYAMEGSRQVSAA